MPDLRRPLVPLLPADEIPDPGNPYLPAVRRVAEAELATAKEPRPDLLAVYVRATGRWRPTVLTGWRQLASGEWMARVQSGLDREPVWVHVDLHTLVPAPVADALPTISPGTSSAEWPGPPPGPSRTATAEGR
ncbi:hypothetical protein ACIA8O_38695 [Kitasatospora sp. NPDC051853]|uniref:hypothetical protein n=1 Tax=Kitasatospora sp. NPDC051853 TaxID=3364058 RepID=UPI00379DA6F3